MKTLFLVLALTTTCVLAQMAAPSLAQMKIAADAGDPPAQDKLAQQFMLHGDMADAETWYRKAAKQGFAHAQGQLGHMLLMHSLTGLNLKPEDRAAIGEEAVKWITLAANQGNDQGEADLAQLCLDGKFVKQDVIQAYKWGELASRGSLFDPATISGRSTRDAAILKMNAEQINEAPRGKIY